MEFLKQATYIRYTIAKLLKFVQISMLTPQNPIYREFSGKGPKKGPGTSFQGIFFIFFDKNLYLVVLHKLAKFHYQTVITSQVVQ